MQFSSSHCGLLGNAICGFTSSKVPLMIMVAGAQQRGVPLAFNTTPSCRNINESDLAAAIGSQVLLLSSEDLSTSTECQIPDTVEKA